MAMHAKTTAPFRPDNLRAIGWIMASVLGSSVMSLCVRQISGEMDSRMIVLCRAGLIALALLAALPFVPRWRQALRFSRPGLHLARGLAIAVSTHLGFYALAHLELVTATVIFFSAPIFASIFGVMFHGEGTGPRRIAAVLMGFLGVIVVLRPGFAAIEPAMFAALGSAFLFGLALGQSRKVATIDGTFSAYFSSVVITAILSIPAALPVMSVPTTPMLLILVLAMTATSALRGVADILAYRHGEAMVLAPIAYTRLIFIGVGAFVFFGEVPDGTALAGAIIIIGAALYIARRAARARI